MNMLLKEYSNFKKLNLLIYFIYKRDTREKMDYSYPLLRACAEGNESEVIRLIEGCDVNFVDVNSGNTPLFLATSRQNMKIVALLLGKGSSTLFRNKNGETALYRAVKLGNLEIINMIIEATSEEKRLELVNIPKFLGKTPLHVAAKKNNPDMVSLLLKLGADVNAKTCLGDTPIFFVLRNILDRQKMLEIYHILVKNGASICHKNNNEETILHQIVPCVGMNQIVEKIIEYEPKIANVKDRHGNTLLHIAILHGKNYSIFLMKYSDVNARNNFGFTPLHYACNICWHTHLKLVAELLKNGAKINEQDSCGDTPLHLVCKEKSLYKTEACIIEILIANGADTTIRNNDSKLAFDYMPQHPLFDVFLKWKPIKLSII